MARSYEGIAEETLTALQTASPNSPLLELIVAEVAVTQDKFPAALAIYRRALVRTPPVGGLHESVADLYERAGHPTGPPRSGRKPSAGGPHTARPVRRSATSWRRACANRWPPVSPSPTPVGRYWTIRAANRLATEAVAHLETLPSSVELHLIRAEIAQSRGQHPESVKEMRAALALAPGILDVEIALAEALLHAHDLKEAIPLARAAEPRSPRRRVAAADARRRARGGPATRSRDPRARAGRKGA